jgi:hypothetical protein
MERPAFFASSTFCLCMSDSSSCFCGKLGTVSVVKIRYSVLRASATAAATAAATELQQQLLRCMYSVAYVDLQQLERCALICCSCNKAACNKALRSVASATKQLQNLQQKQLLW